MQQIPLFDDLRLVGGTALALQLAHRCSIDLDLFGVIHVSHDDIFEALNKAGFQVFPKHETTRIYVTMVNGVKVDIVNYPYDWIESPIEADGIRMAGLKDIAAMKLEAITNRGTKKDFIDIYFLLQHFSLTRMLRFHKEKFAHASVLNVMRSLVYFADAEDNVSPKMIIPVEWEDIKKTIRDAVSNC
jgi:predicted nucleotidyltransferase component of viral defense system